jgi:hypothetical protein
MGVVARIREQKVADRQTAVRHSSWTAVRQLDTAVGQQLDSWTQQLDTAVGHSSWTQQWDSEYVVNVWIWWVGGCRWSRELTRSQPLPPDHERLVRAINSILRRAADIASLYGSLQVICEHSSSSLRRN